MSLLTRWRERQERKQRHREEAQRSAGYNEAAGMILRGEERIAELMADRSKSHGFERWLDERQRDRYWGMRDALYDWRALKANLTEAGNGTDA